MITIKPAMPDPQPEPKPDPNCLDVFDSAGTKIGSIIDHGATDRSASIRYQAIINIKMDGGFGYMIAQAHGATPTAAMVVAVSEAGRLTQKHIDRLAALTRDVEAMKEKS